MNVEHLDKLRDPRLEGTVPCLGQRTPEHSSTPLPSAIQHRETKMLVWGSQDRQACSGHVEPMGRGEQANIFL